MTWRNTRVLVTGGASFIGSHLVEALLQRGAHVRVADNLSSGRRENLDAVTADIDLRVTDLRDRHAAQQAARDCDAVFHLAADHGGRGYIATHPADCAGNMALDYTVFEAAKNNGVERVTFASSACTYPTNVQTEKVPLAETLISFERPGGAFADEAYGWAKLMGELSLRAFHEQYGLKAASVRIFTAFGPRENETHAIIALIAKAYIRQDPFRIWGDGRQTRNFTYVDDIVNALILAAENIEDGAAVNAGTSEFISLNHAAETVFTALAWRPQQIVYLEDKPIGVRHRAASTEYAQARLGWEPTVSFADGVKRTIEWYRATHAVEDVKRELTERLMNR